MITICRADELTSLIDKNEYDAVLSIEHPGATAEHGRAPRLSTIDPSIEQQVMSFWDVEDESAANGPSEHVVLDAFAFLDRHKDDETIVHCHAGKSRSVALALGWIAKQTAQDNIDALDIASYTKAEAENQTKQIMQNAVDYAIDYIKSIRPIAAPNIALIHIIDRLYSFNGALACAVENDSLFTKNRTQANAAREHIAQTRPDLMKELYPEKFGPS